MNPDLALQIIIEDFDQTTGFPPPRVRVRDQAFNLIAAALARDKAAQEAAVKYEARKAKREKKADP